jgi:hypothetical protein
LEFTVAGKLEARLVAVNQQPALREPSGGPEARRGAVDESNLTEEKRKRNESEKERRGDGRHHVERISRLFRESSKPWSRREVLSLGETIFRVDGWNWLLTKSI